MPDPSILERSDESHRPGFADVRRRIATPVSRDEARVFKIAPQGQKPHARIHQPFGLKLSGQEGRWPAGVNNVAAIDTSATKITAATVRIRNFREAWA